MVNTGRDLHASEDGTHTPSHGTSNVGLIAEPEAGCASPPENIACQAEPIEAPACCPPRTDPEREALYADMQPLVRRLLNQYGQDPELRQDLEGEIYCRFCLLLEAYDPARLVPLRAYVVRTLPPAVYSFVRSYWRRQHRETALDEGTSLRSSWRALDPTDVWDERLVLQEVLKALPDAIARLPLRQRQVVIRRYYESRSFEEIATSMEIRVATARSLLRHGINNLRRQIVVPDASPETSCSPVDGVDRR
nr:hypothetical protein Hi04_10k_c1889_00023 [uncultured bacterium]